jgi:two-component system cell cycle response regulator
MQPESQTATQSNPMIDLNDSDIVLLAEEPSRRSVLIADDDELITKYLSSLLRRGGYEVHTARSGEEALRLLDATDCQIVLSDWHMPDMDGLALCRNLRMRTSAGYIYIVMLTVRSGRTDILEGLSAGADDYVVKGATAEEILARVEVGRRITHLERSLRTTNLENRRMSITDPLTGARNRRCLMKYLPRELERSRRYGHPVAILSCDIDHFKRINDGFGHQAGDEILQAFVARSATCIRQDIDWIARSGGEEFVFVLPETGLKGASCVAERLRQALAAQPIATCSGPLSVTVSIGVTALETEQELSVVSVTDLLRAADRCLYASKNQGRDRVTAEAAFATSVSLSNALPAETSEIN